MVILSAQLCLNQYDFLTQDGLYSGYMSPESKKTNHEVLANCLIYWCWLQDRKAAS